MKKLLIFLALLIVFNGAAQGHIAQSQVYPAYFASIILSFEACFTLGTHTGLRGVDEVSQGRIDNDKIDLIENSQQSEPRRIGTDEMDETKTSGIKTPIPEEEITSFKIVFNEVIGDCDSACSTENIVPTVLEDYIERYAPLNETVGALMEMFIDEDEEEFDDIRLSLFDIDGQNVCEIENRLCNKERKEALIERIVQEFLKEMKKIEDLGIEPNDDTLDLKIAQKVQLTEDRLDELIEDNVMAKQIIDESFLELEYKFLDSDFREKHGVGIDGIMAQLKEFADQGFTELDDAVAELQISDDDFKDFIMVLKESERDDLHECFESARAKLEIPKKELEDQVEKGYIAHGYTKAEDGTFIPPVNDTSSLQAIIEDESDPSGRRLIFIHHPDHKSLEEKLKEIREEHKAQEPRRRLEENFYKEKALKIRELKSKVPGHSFELQMHLRKLADDCREGMSDSMCDAEQLSSSALNLGSITDELTIYTDPVAQIFDTLGNFGQRLPIITSLATIINTVLVAAGNIPYVGLVFKIISQGTTKALKVLEKIKDGFVKYKKINGDKFALLFKNVDAILEKVNQGASAVGMVGVMGYGVAIIKENQCVKDLATVFIGDDMLDTVSNAMDNVLSYVNAFMEQANNLLNAFKDNAWLTVNSILDKVMSFLTPLQDLLNPLKPLENLMQAKITLPYFKLPYAEKYIGQAMCDSGYYRGNVLRTQCFERASNKWEEKSGLSLDTMVPPYKMTVKCSYRNYSTVNSLFGNLRSKRCYNTYYGTPIGNRQFRWRGWTPTYFCPVGYSGWGAQCAKHCDHGYSRNGKWCYKNTCNTEYNKNGLSQCIPKEKYQNVKSAKCNQLEHKLEKDASMALWLDGSCRQSCSGGVKKLLGICFPEATIDISLGDIVDVLADALQWLADKAQVLLDAIINGIKMLAGPILKPITDIIDVFGNVIDNMLEAVGMPDLSNITIDILPFNPSELLGGLPEIPNIEEKIDDIKDRVMGIFDEIPIPQNFKDCGLDTTCLVGEATKSIGLDSFAGIGDDLQEIFQQNAVALQSSMDIAQMIECSSWDNITIPMSKIIGMMSVEMESEDLTSCDMKIPYCKEFNADGIKDIVDDATSGLTLMVEKLGEYFQTKQNNRELLFFSEYYKTTDWNGAVFLPVFPWMPKKPKILIDKRILKTYEIKPEKGQMAQEKNGYDMYRVQILVPISYGVEVGILVEANQGENVTNAWEFFTNLWHRNIQFAINPLFEADFRVAYTGSVSLLMHEIIQFFDRSPNNIGLVNPELKNLNTKWSEFATQGTLPKLKVFRENEYQNKGTLICDNTLIDELWYYKNNKGTNTIVDGLKYHFVMDCLSEAKRYFWELLKDPEIRERTSQQSHVKVELGLVDTKEGELWHKAENTINSYLTKLAQENNDASYCDISEVRTWLDKLNKKDPIFVFDKYAARCVKWWSEEIRNIEDGIEASESFPDDFFFGSIVNDKKSTDMEKELNGDLEIDKSHFTFGEGLPEIKALEKYSKWLKDFDKTSQFVKVAKEIYDKIVSSFWIHSTYNLNPFKLEENGIKIGLKISFQESFQEEDRSMNKEEYGKFFSVIESLGEILSNLSSAINIAEQKKIISGQKFRIEYPKKDDSDNWIIGELNLDKNPYNVDTNTNICLQEESTLDGDFWSKEKRECVKFWDEQYRQIKGTASGLLHKIILDEETREIVIQKILSMFPSGTEKERRLENKTWTDFFLSNLVWDTNFFFGGGNPTDGPMVKFAGGLDVIDGIFDPKIERMWQLYDFNKKKIPENSAECFIDLENILGTESEDEIKEFKKRCGHIWAETWGGDGGLYSEKDGGFFNHLQENLAGWSIGKYSIKDIGEIYSEWSKLRGGSPGTWFPIFFEVGIIMEYPIVINFNWENKLSRSHCGDGVCNPDQNECDQCPTDCEKNEMDGHVDNKDDSTKCLYYGLGKCGDGICSPEFGECKSCKKDCPDNDGEDNKCPASPSTVPSQDPSSNPTTSPSTVPSQAPSSNPTTSPSTVPSDD
eukprot:CAMPEP_0197828466 /NCGR_PEP_ID=MMETSP1437-20131217/5014_1 /TAXON_ID=49252 ORGANISM="Eucampia antarctica, Strain CCMP1452" /NCGR_SAMPLE_ID=MMETSP1437 /ASSEMBLY_ACC=CAM_ASM_001096 /LENGTH=2013 /DNA_ID=CAMNT_0043429675 /DNA_START=65 /DNA_END=6106 /DNA_ORIENTATION=+